MNAKQILEEAGLENTYWGEVIIQAEEREGFTEEEKQRANNWNTCACGKHNLPEDMYRHPDFHRPVDICLSDIGEDFGAKVDADQFKNTAYLLIAIEIRVAELLADRPGA